MCISITIRDYFHCLHVLSAFSLYYCQSKNLRLTINADIQLLQGEQSLFATFHCKVSCDIFGEILWFLNGSLVNFGKDLNGMFLNKWASQIESKPCSSDDETDRYHVHSVELLTTSDLSEPLSVYCASVIVCNKEEGCLPTICFSNKKKIRGTINIILHITYRIAGNIGGH